MDKASHLLYYLTVMPADLIFLHGSPTEHCTARVDKHFDGYYTIQYISAGAVELYYDDTRYLLTPGHYWPAFPGPHIRFHVASGHPWWTHRYIAFCGSVATRWMAEGLIPREPQPAPPDWDNAGELDRLMTLGRSPDRWDQRRARNALERLLVELAATRGRSAEIQPWLETTLAHLNKSSVHYPKLAREVGLSLSALRRQFKRATGLSLHAYALQCRVSAARELLADTALPVKEIAEQLGYRDVYFFTRQFRQLTGVPPVQYRRSCQS